MSVDFAALVHAFVAGVADVRACLIVSRDGLALGASPAEEEENALAAWTQIAALGEVDRGFVGLRDEIWVFCRRGPYAALVKGSPSARAGLILDRMEEMLLVAEEVRLKKESFRSADRDAQSPETTPRGPRTTLHRDLREEVTSKALQVPSAAPPAPSVPSPLEVARESAVAQASEGPAAAGEMFAERAEEPPVEATSLDEVDTIALRREFAGILMPSDKRDEES